MASGIEPLTAAPWPGWESQRTVPPMAPSRSAMFTYRPGRRILGRDVLGQPQVDSQRHEERRGRADRVVLAHHKPDRTDQDLDLLAARFTADPKVIVAAEGCVIDL